MRIEPVLPGRSAALAELRRTLRHALARKGLSVEQLRVQASLGRTTVSQALNDGSAAPSERTIAALARVLGLDQREMLALHSQASSGEAVGGVGLARALGRAVPRTLPAGIQGFAGRLDHLVWLDEAAPAIAVVTGTAGVGKTSLAVHWGHRSAALFPDGQLFLDLRGHASAPALKPTQALSLLLQSLGVPGESIPVELDLQIGLYRSQLAERQMLVVLDNAEDTDQVRPLLPGSPSCHVLITSRNALGGLVVREGARRLDLDVLGRQEALELLEHQLGTGRVAAEPEAARELAGLCAHLPLALRIAAANIAARPQRPLEDFTAELRDANRLDRLRVGDDSDAAVAVAFDLSYSALPPAAQHLFNLIGLMPGPDITRPAAAVLAGLPLDAPVPELDLLVSASLVEEREADRFRCHDLLRLYAGRCANQELTGAERSESLHRLYSWYVLTADVAAELINTTFVRLDRTDCGLTGVPTLLSTSGDAVQWLDRELPNLLALIHHAAKYGPRRMSWHLVDALRGHFHASRQDVEWLAAARAALDAAEIEKQSEATAAVLNSFGIAAFCRGDYRAAASRFNEALVIFERVGSVPGRHSAVNNLGEAVHRSGNLREAADYYQQTLQNTPPELAGTVVSLLNLAAVRRDMGQLDDEVLELAESAVERAEQISGGIAICAARYTLASIHPFASRPVRGSPQRVRPCLAAHQRIRRYVRRDRGPRRHSHHLQPHGPPRRRSRRV
jgi:tetratricopeptide (TPR) repeat protein